jgi:hypothetical protein
VSVAAAGEEADRTTGGPGRALAAPPAGAAHQQSRPAQGGWRAVLSGVLLLLAAVGLITRRVFGHGSGRRRRTTYED